MKLVKKYQTSGKFDKYAILDGIRQELVQPNDGTIVVSKNPDVQVEYNPNLKMEGTPNPIAFEQQHPNLASWGKLAQASPFIVAGGMTGLGLGQAAAGTALGQNLINIGGELAADRFIAPALKWGSRALTGLFAAKGAHDVAQGEFTPGTVLDFLPLGISGSRAVNNIYNRHNRFRTTMQRFSSTPTVEAANSPYNLTGLTDDQYIEKGIQELARQLAEQQGAPPVVAAMAARAWFSRIPREKQLITTQNLFKGRLYGYGLDLKPVLSKRRGTLDPETIRTLIQETLARQAQDIANPAEKIKFIREATEKLRQVPVVDGTLEEFILAGSPQSTGGYSRFLVPTSDYPIGIIARVPEDLSRAEPHEGRHLLDFLYPLSSEKRRLVDNALPSTFFEHPADEKITTLLDSRLEAYKILEQSPHIQQILRRAGVSSVMDLPLEYRNLLLGSMEEMDALTAVGVGAGGYGATFLDNLTKAIEKNPHLGGSFLDNIVNSIKKSWQKVGSVVGGSILLNNQKKENEGN